MDVNVKHVSPKELEKIVKEGEKEGTTLSKLLEMAHKNLPDEDIFFKPIYEEQSGKGHIVYFITADAPGKIGIFYYDKRSGPKDWKMHSIEELSGLVVKNRLYVALLPPLYHFRGKAPK